MQDQSTPSAAMPRPAPQAPAMPGQPAAGLPPMPGSQPGAEASVAPQDVPADAVQASPISQHSYTVDEGADGNEETTQRALPNISIQAFCERTETANAVHETTHDWRMKRANLKIYLGGLAAAIEFYHREPTPNMIIIECGMRGNELFAQLEQLASVCDEDTKVIIIGATNDIRLYRQLIARGVSEYIVPPFHPMNLIRAMSEQYTDPEKPFAGRVVAFFGAKGGVGSSTIAHNIAWCAAEVQHQEVSLVDMDTSWGTTGLDFAYDASQGLEEALAQPERLDETLLDRIMVRHTEKLSILPTAGSLSNRPTMSPEAYETVVNGIRGISPLALLDMPHFWSDWTSNILTSSNDVVITAVPDLANLRNTKNLVDFLKNARPNDPEPLLILNQVGRTKTSDISVKDFGSAVGLEPALVIGYEPDIFIEAANDGKMLTDIKGATQTVEGLNYLATRLKTGEFDEAVLGGGRKNKRLSLLSGSKNKDAKPGKEKTSLFSRLKKRK